MRTLSMKYAWLLAVGFLLTISAGAQSNWKIDNSHSNVKFTVTHLVISEVDGHFKNFSGTMTSERQDFADAIIEFTVETNSISTDNENRDVHLKSDDFFNAEKYPQMVFRSGSMNQTGDATYELTGDLTIRNITKKVKFDVRYGGTVVDPWGNTKAGFKATGTINRFDYDLKWNALTEAGGAVVGKDVKITINAEFSKVKP